MKLRALPMDKNPLLSIVIANYNHGLYLEAAIKSVLNQNYLDFELIIVDGASSDNSLEIIKKYQSELAWWVSEKDDGQSEAFNKGFSYAKGDYYFWLNADDILLPNALNHLDKIIKKHKNYKWFAANTIFFDKNGIVRKCAYGPKWNSFLYSKTPINVYGPTSIFHKSLFSKVGGFDETLHYGMDGDLWYKFFSSGEKFFRIRKYYWGFRVHEKSKTSHAYSSVPDFKFSKERDKILKRHNRNKNVFFNYLSILHKLVSGSYLISYMDTIKFKGEQINEVFLNKKRI